MEGAITETIQFTLETMTEIVNDSNVQTSPAIRRKMMYFPTLIQNGLTISTLIFVIGFIGLLGNMMVIFVIYKKTHLAKQIVTRYIINQCALDAFSSVSMSWTFDLYHILNLRCLNIPNDHFLTGCIGFFNRVTLIISEIVALSQLGYVSPTMAKFFCNLWLFKHPIIYGIIISSTYNLVMISIERYISVCFPIFHKTIFTYKVTHVSIAILWIIGIIYNIALGIPSILLAANGRCLYILPSKAKSDLDGEIALAIKIVIPVSLHAFCYIFIAKKLGGGVKIDSSIPQGETMVSINERKEGNEGIESLENIKTSVSTTANNPNQAQTLNKNDNINIINTLAIVTVIYMICWLPQNIYATLFRYGILKSFRGNTYKVFVIMMFANCSVNPFIYIVNYEAIRKAFKSLIGIGK